MNPVTLPPPSDIQDTPAPHQMPEWLTSSQSDVVVRKSKAGRELSKLVFEGMFESVMDEICSGSTLREALLGDYRDIDIGAFNRWMTSDPERNARYEEAKRLRAEIWAGDMITHAKAADSIEDVNRSRLIVDTYKWLMGADHRKKYGANTQIEINNRISILDALKEANSRVIEGVVIDATPLLNNEDNT